MQREIHTCVFKATLAETVLVNGATLSLVLPVRNNAANLMRIVQECMAVLPRHFADYEIIIVEDGSSDTTPAIANNLAATYEPVMVIHHPRPHGYTHALISGWSAARGDYVLAMDADGPIHIGELARFMPYLEHYDIIAGYRLQPGNRRSGRDVQLVNRLFGIELRDVSCHFSLFRADLLHELRLEAASPWSYIEIYMRASRHDLRVVQVGVQAQLSSGTGAAGYPAFGRRWSFWELGHLWLRLRQAEPAEPGQPWQQKAVLGAALAAVFWGVWLLLRRLLLGPRHPTPGGSSRSG